MGEAGPVNGWALAGFLGIWLAGAAWRPFLAGFHGVLRAGMAYGVGLVWISAGMGLLSLLGIPLKASVAIPFLTLIPAVVYWWTRQDGGRDSSRSGNPRGMGVALRDPTWWAFALPTLLLVTIAFGRAIAKPIQAWDAWSAYAFRAKIIYMDEAISRASFDLIAVPNYPLGVPLQEVWMAWAVGSWDDLSIKLLFPGYLVALLCVVYGALRDEYNHRRAMAGTLAVACLPLMLQHAQDGYTDLPLAYFVLAGAVALTCSESRVGRSQLALASVLGGGAVLTREDGALVVAISAVLLLILRRRIMGRFRHALASAALYSSFPAAIWITWALAKHWLGVSSNLEIGGIENASAVRIATEALIRSMFIDGNWIVLWPAFFLLLVARLPSLFTAESAFAVWPVIGYVAAVMMLGTVTRLSEFVLNDSVVHRLILHVAPLAGWWTVRESLKISVRRNL